MICGGLGNGIFERHFTRNLGHQREDNSALTTCYDNARTFRGGIGRRLAVVKFPLLPVDKESSAPAQLFKKSGF